MRLGMKSFMKEYLEIQLTQRVKCIDCAIHFHKAPSVTMTTLRPCFFGLKFPLICLSLFCSSLTTINWMKNSSFEVRVKYMYVFRQKWDENV